MTYYVRIEKPREFRRDLLESSKKIIECLHTYRSIQQIRARKRVLIKTLQEEVKELTLLMTNLDKIMPEKQLRQEAMRELKAKQKKKREKKETKKEQEGKKKKTNKKTATEEKEKQEKTTKTSNEQKENKKEEPKKPLTEVDRLNHTLEEIEKKLANL